MERNLLRYSVLYDNCADVASNMDTHNLTVHMVLEVLFVASVTIRVSPRHTYEATIFKLINSFIHQLT